MIYFRKILHYLVSIPPGSISINKIAKTLEIAHATVYEYLDMLYASGLVRILSRDVTGYNVMKYSEKIYIDNPTLYRVLSEHTFQRPSEGMTREITALTLLQNSGARVVASQI
jgi:predicted AAA+ superfamily ATPase